MNFLGTALELTENVSAQFTETNVSSSQVYHQPLECEALLVKVLKTNQRYPPLSITCKLLLVQTISTKTIFAFRNHISVLQARIRNNCSNLNNDLSINRLRDNPLCNWCNEIEDGKHYFFNCNNYRNERHLFFK